MSDTDSENEEIDVEELNLDGDVIVDKEEEKELIKNKPIVKNIDKNDINIDDVDLDDEEIDEEDLDDDIEAFQEKWHIPDSENIIVVKPENRITSDTLSIYEYTELIGIRAKNIEDGGPYFVSAEFIKGISDPIEIAEIEFQHRKTPLLLKRKVGDKIEIWDPKLMQYGGMINY